MLYRDRALFLVVAETREDTRRDWGARLERGEAELARKVADGVTFEVPAFEPDAFLMVVSHVPAPVDLAEAPHSLYVP